MSRQVSWGSTGEYQADEQAGVAGLSWRVSGRLALRCRAAQLASIRQMSGQVSRGKLASIRQDRVTVIFRDSRLYGKGTVRDVEFTVNDGDKSILPVKVG